MISTSLTGYAVSSCLCLHTGSHRRDNLEGSLLHLWLAPPTDWEKKITMYKCAKSMSIDFLPDFIGELVKSHSQPFGYPGLSSELLVCHVQCSVFSSTVSERMHKEWAATNPISHRQTGCYSGFTLHIAIAHDKKPELPQTCVTHSWYAIIQGVINVALHIGIRIFLFHLWPDRNIFLHKIIVYLRVLIFLFLWIFCVMTNWPCLSNNMMNLAATMSVVTTSITWDPVTYYFHPKWAKSRQKNLRYF